MDRRSFLSSAAAASLAFARSGFAGSTELSHKERVDRALAGAELDRPPFTFYHHYNRPTATLEASDHLAFHRDYKTDIVKVMNDFQYPASKTGRWYELKPIDSPYPSQIETLKLVRDGLKGNAYFIDTLYGPYMTAMIMFQSQPEFAKFTQAEGEKKVIPAIAAFQREHPDEWHAALDAITQSTINHIHRSLEIGASGALVSLFNTASDYGPVEVYNRYSRAYDKRVLDALSGTKLTVLHLHNLDRAYLGQFTDFYAPVLQYSIKESGIPIADARKVYSQVIAAGVDEIDFKKLTTAEMKAEWMAARKAAGAKYIAMPGCSVPNSSTPEELGRFPRSLGV